MIELWNRRGPPKTAPTKKQPLFEVDGTWFALSGTTPPQGRDYVLLNKPDEVVDFYRHGITNAPRNVLIFGIADGASVILLDKVHRPVRVVGMEPGEKASSAAERYAREKTSVHLLFGQALPSPEVVRLVRSMFESGIDLFVDSASHMYEHKKQTFQSVYPLLVPGAKYVIEGWAWSHMPNQQSREAPWADQHALTNLVFELVIMAGVHGAIESIHIQKGLICITKGRGDLPSSAYDLAGLLRGRAMSRL